MINTRLWDDVIHNFVYRFSFIHKLIFTDTKRKKGTRKVKKMALGSFYPEGPANMGC